MGIECVDLGAPSECIHSSCCSDSNGGKPQDPMATIPAPAWDAIPSGKGQPPATAPVLWPQVKALPNVPQAMGESDQGSEPSVLSTRSAETLPLPFQCNFPMTSWPQNNSRWPENADRPECRPGYSPKDTGKIQPVIWGLLIPGAYEGRLPCLEAHPNGHRSPHPNIPAQSWPQEAGVGPALGTSQGLRAAAARRALGIPHIFLTVLSPHYCPTWAWRYLAQTSPVQKRPCPGRRTADSHRQQQSLLSRNACGAGGVSPTTENPPSGLGLRLPSSSWHVAVSCFASLFPRRTPSSAETTKSSAHGP